MKKSTDSRTLGTVKITDVIGRVVAHLPAAIASPKSRYPWTGRLSYGLAVLMIIFALLHLYRIDTLVPIIEAALGADLGAAALITALIVSAEVFALPFLLMMRLSPLGHVVSGLLALLVPLTWVSVSIWALGNENPTGQFGEFLLFSASGWLIMLNLLWLTASYGLLWLRRYDETYRRLSKPA